MESRLSHDAAFEACADSNGVYVSHPHADRKTFSSRWSVTGKCYDRQFFVPATSTSQGRWRSSQQFDSYIRHAYDNNKHCSTRAIERKQQGRSEHDREHREAELSYTQATCTGRYRQIQNSPQAASQRPYAKLDFRADAPHVTCPHARFSACFKAGKQENKYMD